MRILLVEDNLELAGNICDYLELNGILTDHANTGKQSFTLIERASYDVIIMDVMMPGIDGFETCRQLRQRCQCQIPTIFLTARTDLEDKIKGFEAGADDYLTKPFAMAELHCRLLALHMRGKRQDIGELSFLDLKLNTQTGLVTRAGLTVNLNKIQYQILLTLIKHSPAIVSRDDLEYEIWGEDLPDTDILRSHIYQLRKIIDKPFTQAYIQTVHGKGIKLSIGNS
ncbi:MAG: response regulator transcription factor [Oceanospirillaceae bacterium]